jgi:hypothetical protein
MHRGKLFLTRHVGDGRRVVRAGLLAPAKTADVLVDSAAQIA